MLVRAVPAEAAEHVGIYVEGPDADEVRDLLATGAPKGVSVTAADPLLRALTRGGHAPFIKNMDDKAHDAEVSRVREAAATLGLDAVLLGRVRRDGRRRRVRLLVIDQAGGEKDLHEVVYEPGTDGGDADLVSRAGQALAPYAHDADAASPSAPGAANHSEPPAGTTPEARDEAPGAAEPRRPGVFNRSLLDVEVGGDAVGRQFDYHDGVSNNLRSYEVAPAAMLSAAAVVFPFADAPGVLRDIGLTGSYDRSLLLKSALAGGSDVPTTESAYSFGLRIRIHPWGDGTLIGVSYEYADRSFDFAPAGPSVDGQVPSVDYRANRTAVDVRIPFGSFALLAGAAFRAVLSAGDVASRFRAPSVNGVDGELGASVTVTLGWEARLLLDYERYFYAFQPTPGDGYIAGGALDQFFGGRLAMAYVF